MNYATIDRDGCHGDYTTAYELHDSLADAEKAERRERAKHSRYQVALVPSGTNKGAQVHRNDIKARGLGI